VPAARSVGGLQHDVHDRLLRPELRASPVRRRRGEEPQRAAGRQRPVARGHARVVHVLTAAGTQLRHRAVRDERAPAARPAAKARGQGSVVTRPAPGPLLRATAVGGAVAAAVVVGAAAVSSGEAHKGFALIALPLLAGVAAAALWTYPRLVAPATIAF